MKVLALINHFFGHNPNFIGKSSLSAELNEIQIQEKKESRKKIIQTVVDELKKIDGIEIKICGINGFNLVPIDIEFNHITNKTIFLVYETLNYMSKLKDQYDYFMNLEDDILFPNETFQNILKFDKENLINEIFLPNRLEKKNDGEIFCVDLFALKGFTTQTKNYNGKILKVALNPHSGLLVVSKEKLNYLLNKIDINSREIILGTGMESAFAHFHSPFSLFRSSDLNFHHVVHLDKWTFSERDETKNQNFFSKLSFSDFIPPIIMYIFRKLTKIIKGKF